MLFHASELAASIGGTLVGPDVEITRVTQDSREAGSGALFVPLVAERDGHQFIGAALDAGTAAYLTARDAQGGSAIVVDETSLALLRIGATARDRVNGPVVGVTGSVGKTSTKDLLAAVLSVGRRAHVNTRSFNNEIGVPLTLANAPDGTDAVVVEMGARHPGDIAALCAIARPTVGVITTIGAAHVGVFGSPEAIAEGKGELYEALPPDGCAVVNAESTLAMQQARRTRARVIAFGDGGEIRAADVVVDRQLRPSFRMETPWGRAAVRLEARGAHNVSNALAAAAVGLIAEVPLDLVADALGRGSVSPWRMDIRETKSGAMIINDAYNANPMSVTAALRSLSAVTARRKIAVLGVMAELGDTSPSAHLEMAALARELGIEALSVDAAEYGVANFADIDAVEAELGVLGEGDVVLVKGSRVAGLERLADRLLR